MSTSPTVTVRVPGSTSNCGAGFDTLGLAVARHNRATVTAAGSGREIRARRPAAARAQKMVEGAAALFFRETGRAPFGFAYDLAGEVPVARGLGSSVTVRAGIVAALDALAGTNLTRHRIVELVTVLEGHPDNAAAGVLGGFCVARADPATGAFVDAVRAPVPAELAFVTAAPLVEIPTEVSRGALPAQLPYFDAVRSINSAAYLVAAMLTGDYARLSRAGSDFMHEPYRLPGIPGAAAAIAAGVKAGAWTGWLSGSGSSVMCVCPQTGAAEVLAAMRGAFQTRGLPCEAWVLTADNDGLRVI